MKDHQMKQTLKEFIEKKMRGKKIILFHPDHGDGEMGKMEFVKLPDAIDIAYGIMRDMGFPENLEFEIEDETETD